MANKKYVCFVLDGREICRYDLANEAEGERANTIALLAYEHDVEPEKIKVFTGDANEIVQKRKEWVDECPLGGDITDDCADCPYAGDYHYQDGECVRRNSALAV